MSIVKPVILEGGQLKTAGVGDQVPQAFVQGLDTSLATKVDKVSGKGLSDTNFTQVEKTKLNDVAVGATKNRVDTLNADKVHTHTTAQVTGLDTALAGKTDKTTQVIAGTGLTGGGTLAANRTLTVSYGTAAGTAAQGNDSRITGALQSSQVVQVTGTSTTNVMSQKATTDQLDTKANTTIQVIAGTGLTGGGTLAANRTLAVSYGTAAGTAAQGNDSRLSNSREWTAETLTQAEAEAGTATTRRAFTAQRVRQAIVAWWNSTTSAWGRGLVNSADAAAGRTALGLGNVDNTRDSIKQVGSFAIHDTRAVISTPENVPDRSGLFEFKSVASVGSPPKPSAPAYAHVLTTNGYTADGTGGWPTQVSLGDALSFRKGATLTTWGPWREIISTDTTLGATGQSTLYPMTQKATTDALNLKANTSTQVIAGTGLTGGGTLAANRTLAVTYGTAAGTAAQGNDTRINNGQTAFGWGSHASEGYAKTKADVGLSGIPNTNASTANFLRGDGTWVTPPNTNTTYAEITDAEIDAGTASTLRTISGRRMKYALDKKSDTGHGHSISDVTGVQAAIDSKANTATQVIAGTGLTGGGTLAANRTLTVSYGTAAGTAAQGNDSRIVNAVPNSRTITAGTGLTGGGTLAANRTLTVSYGTTAGTAAQGNDSRITGALQTSQVVQTTGASTTNLMSQKAVTDAIANISPAQSGSTPVGYGVSNNSYLTMFTDSQGRKFLQSGYVLPLEQVPDATSDMISPQFKWTVRVVPGGDYKSITNKDNLLVAVGPNFCATSPDGITWTSQTFPTGYYASVAYGNGLFVAVGNAEESGVYATSPDGITWTSQTFPTEIYSSVAFNNGLFIALGNNWCASSPDGITWTSRTIPTGVYSSVTYGNGLFVAVGSYVCATSPDGITWTARSLSGFYASVIYANGVFVAVGSNWGASSPDGITWTSQTYSTWNFKSVAFNNGVFVAIGNSASNGVYATSQDGITWTTRTGLSGFYNSVRAYDNLFIAVGDYGSCAACSISLVVGFEKNVPYLYMRIL